MENTSIVNTTGNRPQLNLHDMPGYQHFLATGAAPGVQAAPTEVNPRMAAGSGRFKGFLMGAEQP